MAQRGDPPADVRSGELLDVALELVDRLVQPVQELEEGVGHLVDDPLEDSARRGLRVDERRDAVDGRELAPRGPGLPHGHDRCRRRDDVELEVLDATLPLPHLGGERTAST